MVSTNFLMTYFYNPSISVDRSFTQRLKVFLLSGYIESSCNKQLLFEDATSPVYFCIIKTWLELGYNIIFIF